jgi:hypothetical protein
MSYDETPAHSQKKRSERQVFDAADYVRPDWNAEDVIYLLERRARGYNGLLRQILCTAAAMLRNPESLDLAEKELTKALENKDD